MLQSVSQVLKLYHDTELFDVELYIRRGKNSTRLNQPLDFSGLPFTHYFFDEEININKPLSETAKSAVEVLLAKAPSVFIFFQEQDPLMVILAGRYADNGAEVHLYQDGLKPYVHIRFHSLGLIKHHHTQNVWLSKHGFKVDNWLLPLWSKKYAHIKGIAKVFLTFPESYQNWNGKPIEKMEFLPLAFLNPVLKKLFNWQETLLPEREKIIFYLNQPMRDDGIFETQLLSKIIERFPDTKIYTKNHPSTSKNKIELYKKLKNLQVIDSPIPAELFIMNLSESIVFSMGSTSMFLDNPGNKFYYIYELLENDIKRLRRYKMCNPAPHIKSVSNIDELSF